MRKPMMVLGLMVVVVPLLAAAAAPAAQEGRLIHCGGAPCYGGKGDDKIFERVGDRKDDVIVPRGGGDRVLASSYTNDTDVVRRGGGSDRINVADGDALDTANGGKGRDLCIVDRRKEVGAGCFRVEVRR